MRDMTTYRASRTDTSMGLGRSITILLPDDEWVAIDLVARKKNKNKSALLRPLIAAFVSRELKRHRIAKSV